MKPTGINHKYLPLYKTKKEIILVTGGRGSAKSFEVSRWLQRLTFEKGHTILFTRYTLDSASLSIIPEFRDKIDREGTEEKFHITRNDIVNTVSGSSIKFRGIKTQGKNQTAKLKSIEGLTTFVVDEAEEWPSDEEFKTISRSIRIPGIQNRVVIIMNSASANHWVWQMFFKDSYKTVEIDGHKIEMSTHPKVRHIHTTYLDNVEHLSEGFLADAAETKANRPEEYRHAFLGGWKLKAENVIYPNWTEGTFDESLPFCYGMDFGYSDHPTALVKVAVDHRNRKIYAKTLLYSPGLGFEEIYDQIKDIKDGTIVGDRAEDRLIGDLQDKGIDIVPCFKRAGSVLHGIKKIQSYTIIVSPDDSHLKFELDNYKWKAGIREVPEKINDDALDALRYAFRELE